MRRLTFDQSDVVVQLLADGAVVAIPTDTVYGVGARLDRPDAVARLFQLKNRPTTVALPVLIGSLDQLDELGVQLDERASELARAFWPGPMTMVLSANETLATRVGSAQATIGVRWPRDEQLSALLRQCGPLAVTSANQHGHAPCTSAEQVAREFGEGAELDAIIDGGVRSGAVSTVLAVTNGEVVVVRAGAISAEEVAAALSS